jgi:branched-chain amino acid transport system permease protein
MNRHLLGLGALIVVGALYPLALPAYLTLAITVLLFAGWATAWDILGGWNGQVSLGHASFVGLGAYFVALGQSRYEIDPWWSVLLAMVVAAALA